MAKQANANGTSNDVKDDIVCAIDNLDYLQVIPECRDTEPVAPEMAKQAKADGKISDVKDDIVCAIDNLDYLQVIPECRDTEPGAPEEAQQAKADGKISEVSGFRQYKGNQQWYVRWSNDGAVSWETWDKLDSEPIRAAAKALQTA